MFIRSVKKIINTGSGVLWDGSETNLKKSVQVLNDIEELLETVRTLLRRSEISVGS